MDFDLFSLDDEVEDREKVVTSRSLKIQEKTRAKLKMRKENAEGIFTELPEHGESIHIVSNGDFDYFNLVPIACEMIAAPCKLRFSTWTMNIHNARKLIALYDEGAVTEITGLTGLYFKNREPAVWEELLAAMTKRKQRIFASKNHAKVVCLTDGKKYIVIEGSANFTTNPRIEQFAVINSRELHDFHVEWMEELSNRNGEQGT